jgi:pimeloyl-ACP methyl ester carboxylesterase
MTSCGRRQFIGGLLVAGLAGCATPSRPADTPVRRAFRARDGERLSYLELGRGRPVILLHGFLANAQLNWFDTGVAQCLAARGARVIAPDFRGHGVSTRSAAPYAADLLASDQEDLLRHLGIKRYSLGGYSLGSRMAVRMMVRGARPDRACLGGMGDTGLTSVDQRRALFEDLVVNGAQARNPRAGAFVAELMRRTGLDTPSLLQVLAQQRSTSPEQLAAIRTPTTLVCGVADQDNGSAQELARLLGTATLVQVPGDHLSAIRTAEFRSAVCRALA